MAVAQNVLPLVGGALRIDVSRAPGEVLLALDGELDLATVPQLATRLAEVLAEDAGARVVLDLAGLGFMDAVGVGQIVRASRQVRGQGGALEVVRASRAARRLLALCDLGELMRDGAPARHRHPLRAPRPGCRTSAGAILRDEM